MVCITVSVVFYKHRHHFEYYLGFLKYKLLLWNMKQGEKNFQCGSSTALSFPLDRTMLSLSSSVCIHSEPDTPDRGMHGWLVFHFLLGCFRFQFSDCVCEPSGVRNAVLSCCECELPGEALRGLKVRNINLNIDTYID